MIDFRSYIHNILYLFIKLNMFHFYSFILMTIEHIKSILFLFQKLMDKESSCLYFYQLCKYEIYF
jgi:hypothetical protein